jgi:hypothetical protein
MYLSGFPGDFPANLGRPKVESLIPALNLKVIIQDFPVQEEQISLPQTPGL